MPISSTTAVSAQGISAYPSPSVDHDVEPASEIAGFDQTRLLDVQVAPKFSDVAGGLDVVLRDGDLALFVDNERRADHALTVLPYIFFSP